MKEQLQYMAMVLTAVLCPFVILGNAFAITILFWSPKLRRKSPVVFILNLLLTHLMQGVLVMPMYALRKAGTYPKSMYPYVCDVWRMSYMVTFYGACVFVLLVAIDRFIAVKFVLLYKGMIKYRHFLVAVCLSWIYIILLCLLPFLNAEKSSKCNYNQQFQWTIYMLFANTVVPYVLVIICYLYIVKCLRESQRKVSGSPGENEPTAQCVMKLDECKRKISRNQGGDEPTTKCVKKASDWNRKVTMLSLRITLIYGITWAPSIIYYLIVALTPGVFSEAYYVSPTEMVVTFLIKYITFFDALLAPFLYCYFHRDFRNEIARFFRTYVCNRLVHNSSA